MAKKILAYLEDQQDSMIDFLKALVYLESPSGDASSQDALLFTLANEFSDLNFYTFRKPGRNTGGYLYARPQYKDKSKKIQLLVGHCDTVWERNTLEKMPVMNLDGKLTGPGVFDMKAGITQIIFALKAIQDCNLDIPMTPVILINSDEEIGSVESTDAIARLSKISNRAYILEPPLGIKGKLKTARKGIGRFTITVEGKAAHAGLDPGAGVNAIVELSGLVQKLYAMNDFEKGITVNVGMIQGGVSANVVAPTSSAVVDVRVQTNEDGDLITQKILNLRPSSEDITLNIEGGIGRPPLERTKRNQALWQLARAEGLAIGLELEDAMAGGGSDGNTTSQFTATLDGLGTTGDGAHALHEHILIDELTQRTALLVLLLMANEVLHEKEE